MALVKCPECGKEVSDKAPQCIHCGFPMKKTNEICEINGTTFNLSNWLAIVQEKQNMSREDRWNLARELRVDIGGNIIIADTILNEIIQTGEVPPKYIPPIRLGSTPTVPTCPKCGSTSITTGPRGVNGIWGFIGASNTVNRCSNCGHTWEPKKR